VRETSSDANDPAGARGPGRTRRPSLSGA